MTFGVGGPVLVVKDVAVEAEPVDFDLLRTFNGGPFPVDWQVTDTGGSTVGRWTMRVSPSATGTSRER